MSRAHIKPLVHWAIARGYTIRFGMRDAAHVTGTFTTPGGEIAFAYNPIARIITLDGDSATLSSATLSSATPSSAKTIAINEYGWEEHAT